MLYKSGCKINLGLRILDKREDGYHNLETLFYPLAKPYDELEIKKTKEIGIHVTYNIADIDIKNNTLTKAYNLYFAQNPVSFGINVDLKKGVPHGAGLGGGSANAAIILSYLQAQSETPISFDKLLLIASKIGADVPFFLYNTPCYAQGIGDILTPCSFSLKGKYLLLLMPDIHISTPWAFKSLALYKKLLTSEKEQAKRTRSSFLGDLYLENDFEHVVFKEYLSIQKAKELMIQNGAIFSSLSGTGAALYGVFVHEQQMQNAIRALSMQGFFQSWKYVSIDEK